MSQGLAPLVERLDRAIALLEALCCTLGQQHAAATLQRQAAGTPQGHVLPQTPQPSPQVLGTYDPLAAVARMQVLRREGLSYDHIAAMLQAEGVPTRAGHPWQGSSVRYLLERYGQ